MADDYSSYHFFFFFFVFFFTIGGRRTHPRLSSPTSSSSSFSSSQYFLLFLLLLFLLSPENYSTFSLFVNLSTYVYSCIALQPTLLILAPQSAFSIRVRLLQDLVI